MPDFPDHFSNLAADYRAHRPRYPQAIARFLAEQASSAVQVWDVGTGSGQAALDLAEVFPHVIATDASADQIAQAPRHPRIEFRTEKACASSIPDGTIDVVTIAAALHWMDLRRFYAEVERVTRPGAVFAAWTYTTSMQIEAGVDAAVERIIDDDLAPYWTPQFALVREGYRTLELPWEPLAAPPFAIAARWSLADLMGHIDTWSAAGLFAKANGRTVSEQAHERLSTAWGDVSHRDVSIPVHLRWCRRPS